MTDRPLVTFFVMAYRQEALVRAAIESAFAQTWEPLEIVLSDDNSPDGTFRVMEEMAAAYRGPHRVVLNRNPRNLGVTGHLDRIMQIASGDFVVQNAGDDVSEPERTARLAEAWLASGRRAKVVHSAIAIIDAEGREVGRRRSPDLIISDPTPYNIVAGNLYAHGAAMGWDREVFDAFGPLAPDAIIEDKAIPFRAALLGGLAFVDAPLVRWRVGGLSSDHDPDPGREWLQGVRLKRQRWRVGSLKVQMRDAARLPEAERARVIAAAEDALAPAALDVALADAGPLGRLALLPRAAALTLRRRSVLPLRQWLRYQFAPLYIRWMRRKAGRPSAAEAGAGG